MAGRMHFLGGSRTQPAALPAVYTSTTIYCHRRSCQRHTGMAGQPWVMLLRLHARVEQTHLPIHNRHYPHGPNRSSTKILNLSTANLCSLSLVSHVVQARVEQIHSPIRNRRHPHGPEDRVIPETKPRGRAARAAAAANHAQQDARCTPAPSAIAETSLLAFLQQTGALLARGHIQPSEEPFDSLLARRCQACFTPSTFDTGNRRERRSGGFRTLWQELWRSGGEAAVVNKLDTMHLCRCLML